MMETIVGLIPLDKSLGIEEGQHVIEDKNIPSQINRAN